MFDIENDFMTPTRKAIQKVSSFRGLIPSVDFTPLGYVLYLQYAHPWELDQDIVSEKTYLKIVKEGGCYEVY